MDDSYGIKPLHIMLPKASAYVKSYDGETKWIYFLIGDDELLNDYHDIWNKVSNSIKKFDSKTICIKKFLKSKIKSYSVEAKDFHDKEMSKVDSNCIKTIIHKCFQKNVNTLVKKER